MRRITITVTGLIVALCMPLLTASATETDRRIMVPLPDLSAISNADAKTMLAVLAQINVIASNCPEYNITDGEWTLLIGTGDMLAKRLGLDPEAYETDYYGPAFRMLNKPESCDEIGPSIQPIINDLIRLGGRTEPVSE